MFYIGVKYMKNLISINDLTKEQIVAILDKADEFKNGSGNFNLNNKVIASCFFEASTRTRLSFEAAVNYLGGRVIGFSEATHTSLGAKGESLIDTFKVIDGYADCLILRHPLDGAARLAAEMVQTRNNADALIHSTRKSLSEYGDKVDAETKDKIEQAIKEVEDALKADDKARIEEKVQALMTASQKLGEMMYQEMQQNQAQQGAAEGESAEKGKDDNVIDAEYSEVKDDKK